MSILIAKTPKNDGSLTIGVTSDHMSASLIATSATVNVTGRIPISLRSKFRFWFQLLTITTLPKHGRYYYYDWLCVGLDRTAANFRCG